MALSLSDLRKSRPKASSAEKLNTSTSGSSRGRGFRPWEEVSLQQDQEAIKPGIVVKDVSGPISSQEGDHSPLPQKSMGSAETNADLTSERSEVSRSDAFSSITNEVNLSTAQEPVAPEVLASQEFLPSREQPDNNQITTRKHPDNAQVTTGEQPGNSKVSKSATAIDTVTCENEPLEVSPDDATVRPDSNQVTSREQPGNSWIATREQQKEGPVTSSNDRVTAGYHPGSSQETIRGTDRVTTGYHLGNWGQPKQRYSSLVGNERKMVDLIYESAQRIREKYTEELSSEYICERLQISDGTKKVTVSRLKKKNIIRSFFSKQTRGGWTQYELNGETYAEILASVRRGDRVTAGYHPGNTQEAIRGTDRVTASSSSSSNSLSSSFRKELNTTTGFESAWDKLPSDWKNIDFTQVQEALLETKQECQFGKKQIVRLFEMNQKDPDLDWTAQKVQTFLEHLAFGIMNGTFKPDHVKYPRQTVIEFFEVRLRQTGYFVIPGFRSKKEIAREAFLKETEEQNARIREQEERLFTACFAKWMNALHSNDRFEISQQTNHYMQLYKLKEYFEQQIWPWAQDYLSFPFERCKPGFEKEWQVTPEQIKAEADRVFGKSQQSISPPHDHTV